MMNSPLFLTAAFEYREVKNASHWLQLDKRDEINALLLERLEKYRGQLASSEKHVANL